MENPRLFELKESRRRSASVPAMYWVRWKNAHDREYGRRAPSGERVAGLHLLVQTFSCTSQVKVRGLDQEHDHRNAIDIQNRRRGQGPRHRRGGGIHQFRTSPLAVGIPVTVM